MDEAKEIETNVHTPDAGGKVVNLAFYRIKRSLKSEGFDLISDNEGNLTLVMRLRSK